MQNLILQSLISTKIINENDYGYLTQSELDPLGITIDQ